MAYSDDLKNPLWQRKRLEIMERDQFQCQCCFDRKSHLVVHHKWYSKGFKAWEYENDCYVTLCKNCHEIFHSFYENEHNNYIAKYISDTDFFLFEKYFIEASNYTGTNTLKQINKMLISMAIKEEDL